MTSSLRYNRFRANCLNYTVAYTCLFPPTNRCWSMCLRLGGTYSRVDSRSRSVALGYSLMIAIRWVLVSLLISFAAVSMIALFWASSSSLFGILKYNHVECYLSFLEKSQYHAALHPQPQLQNPVVFLRPWLQLLVAVTTRNTIMQVFFHLVGKVCNG